MVANPDLVGGRSVWPLPVLAATVVSLTWTLLEGRCVYPQVPQYPVVAYHLGVLVWYGSNVERCALIRVIGLAGDIT